MTPCATIDELTSLLTDSLTAPRRDELSDHLERCVTCQRSLEQLTSGDGPHPSRTEELPAGWSEEVPAFLSRLVREAPTLIGSDKTASGPFDPRPVGSAPPGYEFLGELGRGGMGIVYKARQTTLNRIVALKFVATDPNGRNRHVERFRSEAQAVAKLHHPNIVQIYSFGEHEGRPYFAMEYVSGPSLAAYMEGRPQPPSEAADLLATLARAVHAAHVAGIVHRDLKPANILLKTDKETRRHGDTETDRSSVSVSPCLRISLSSAVPKITDFGLAKDAGGSELTHSGTVIGTPQYMSPEQAGGRSDVGPAADVWSMGVLLYEMIAGRCPFRGVTPAETLYQVVFNDPVPPRRLQPGVPRDVETICLKCLDKEPAKRYATALELAEDLDRFRAGEPIRARAPGPLGRGWRWARRRPSVAGLLAALVLLGVAASGLVVWKWRDAVRERNAKDVALAEAVRLEREAIAQRDAAREARRRTREALDQVSSEAIDTLLMRQPRLTDEHRAFLTKSLSFYEELAQVPAQTPQERVELAKAFFRMGRVRHYLGRTEEAQTSYRRCGELLDALIAENPNEPDYRRNLYVIWNNTGLLYARTGKVAEAEACYRKAIAARDGVVVQHTDAHVNLATLLRGRVPAADVENLLRTALKLQLDIGRDRPDDLGARLLSASIRNNLADLLLVTGRRDEAEPFFRAALPDADAGLKAVVFGDDYVALPMLVRSGLAKIAVLDGRGPDAVALIDEAERIGDGIVAHFPSIPAYRVTLSHIRRQAAQLAVDQNRPADAEAALRRAALDLQPLVQMSDPTAEHLDEAATVRAMYGLALLNANRVAPAVAEFEAALALREQLQGLGPGRVDHINNLAGTMVNRAIGLMRLGRIDEAIAQLRTAEPHHRAALKAAPNAAPCRLFYRNNRFHLAAASFARSDHHTAAQATEEVLTVVADPRRDVYEAARYFLRCGHLAAADAGLPPAWREALAETYWERALVVLRQAIANGFPREELRQRAGDFAPLANRPEFRALVEPSR